MSSYKVSRLSKDGSILLDKHNRPYEPCQDSRSFFILNDGAVDPQINKAINNFYVKDFEAMAYTGSPR